MRYGIPAYRLSHAVLDAEISRVVALGIGVRCGWAMESPQALAELRAGFDAIYLAYGARRQKRLPQLDYSRPWAVDGADYLARAEWRRATGARSARGRGGRRQRGARRGAQRPPRRPSGDDPGARSRGECPAQRDEVVEAPRGGHRTGRRGPASRRRRDRRLRLDCVRVHVSAGAHKGQFTLTPLDGTAFTLEADAIVSAIGQDPDLAPLAGAVDCRGTLLHADASGATAAAGVWAGGDLTSTSRHVADAIGMGERAARAIERELDARAGSVTGAAPCDAQAPVELAAINLHYHPAQPRAAAQRLDATQRLADGAEVQLGLVIEQAMAEAARCFSCGTCTHCDNCVTYCPDLAVQRAGDGYTVLTDYCKGCGVCVKECPTGSMTMQEELR